MRLIINKYSSKSNPYKLEPHNCTTWLNVNDFNKMLDHYPAVKESNLPVYAKIECKEDMGEFVMYSRIAQLPNTPLYNSVGDNFLWIAKETLPINEISTNKKDELNVEVVQNLKDLSHAESITIKLVEDDVDNWSEEEFASALSHFKQNIHLTSLGQKHFYCPGTKDAVIATIGSVVPKPDSSTEPFIIDENTEFIVEGKPVNARQTIDFSQIGGQEKVINELRHLIQLPLNFPDYFAKFGVEPPKGVLLYGPPGNGKTMIARAVAQSFGASFIEIDLSDALQKYKGVGEHNLEKKFEAAEKKRNSVIFIDEIDAIASIRCEDSEGHEVSLVGKLLSLMDGIKARHRVFVIGATNRLWAIDPALRRPHRFDKEIEVPQPDETARLDILLKYIHLDAAKMFDDTIDMNYIKTLAKQTEGYSGADISALYAETVMSAINRYVSIDNKGKADISVDREEVLITKNDFENAFKIICPTSQRSKITEQHQ